MKVLVVIALTVAVFGFVTSSAASEAHQKNVRTTHKDEDSGAVQKEGKVDVINKIQLEDQAFWDRTLSMSTFSEGDSSYAGCCDYCGNNCGGCDSCTCAGSCGACQCT